MIEPDVQERRRRQQREKAQAMSNAAAGLNRLGMDSLYEPQVGSKDQQGINQGSIREGFKKKVYGLVICMLVVTFLWVLLNLSSVEVGKFVLTNAWLNYTCIGLIIPLTLIVICCRQSIKHPLDYICLAIYTLLQSYLVAYVCDSYAYRWDFSVMPENVKMILMAFGMTCFLVAVLSIVAVNNCFDMTRHHGYLMMGGFILLMMAPLMIILKPLRGFMCWFSLVIYSLYIVYDIQMIQGESYAKYGIDDWVIASIQVYTDIIQIFLRLLQILAD